MTLAPSDFFDLSATPHAGLFDGAEFVWDGLKRIKSHIKETIRPNVEGARNDGMMIPRTTVIIDGRVYTTGFQIGAEGVVMDGDVVPAAVIYEGAILFDDAIQLDPGAVVEPGAMIKGPTIIGPNTEVRHAAYIRGNVLIGANCVVGHTTEMKHSVMLGNSAAGHFAYIGDSILGDVNLGAGTKIANLKITESEVAITVDGQRHETGLRKFGAILGDGVELGCNTVTLPGALVGRGTVGYPNASLRGYIPPNSIVKVRQTQEIVEAR